jgi:hypothetical protein
MFLLIKQLLLLQGMDLLQNAVVILLVVTLFVTGIILTHAEMAVWRNVQLEPLVSFMLE